MVFDLFFYCVTVKTIYRPSENRMSCRAFLNCLSWMEITQNNLALLNNRQIRHVQRMREMEGRSMKDAIRNAIDTKHSLR